MPGHRARRAAGLALALGLAAVLAMCTTRTPPAAFRGTRDEAGSGLRSPTVRGLPSTPSVDRSDAPPSAVAAESDTAPWRVALREPWFWNDVMWSAAMTECRAMIAIGAMSRCEPRVEPCVFFVPGVEVDIPSCPSAAVSSLSEDFLRDHLARCEQMPDGSCVSHREEAPSEGASP